MAGWKARIEFLLSVIGLLFLSLSVEALQGKRCQDSLLSGGGRSVRAKISGEGVVLGEYFWVIPRSQAKRHDDRFSRFRAGDCRVSLCFTTGAPFPHNCPFPWGNLNPNLTRFLWPISAHNPRHLDRFCRFCTYDHRVSLYFTMGRHFPLPLKIVPSHGGSGPLYGPSGA